MLRKRSFSILCLACLVIFSAFIVSSGEAFEPESIVGVWLFDEGGGVDALDSTEKGHDGMITGGPKWVDGKFGEALEFAGNGKVSVPHADEFTTPTFTLMAWILVEAPNASWQLIVGKDGWPDRNYAMFVAQNSGALHFAFCAPGQQDVGNFNTPTIVADDEWHHVAITYDLAARKAYIDGVLDAQQPLSVEPSQNAVPVEIARSYAGIIDEVLIANQAFSEDDIQEAMEIGLAQFIGGGRAVSASDKLIGVWGAIKAD